MYLIKFSRFVQGGTLSAIYYGYHAVLLLFEFQCGLDKFVHYICVAFCHKWCPDMVY